MSMAPEFDYAEWHGYWLQPGGPERHPMNLTLKFEAGRISGLGDDEVGMFLIDGVYDEKSMLCSWTKKYVAMHEVLYNGKIEGRTIQGRWALPRQWSGEFSISLGPEE